MKAGLGDGRLSPGRSHPDHCKFLDGIIQQFYFPLQLLCHFDCAGSHCLWRRLHHNPQPGNAGTPSELP